MPSEDCSVLDGAFLIRADVIHEDMYSTASAATSSEKSSLLDHGRADVARGLIGTRICADVVREEIGTRPCPR